jgi:hypothetical protein
MIKYKFIFVIASSNELTSDNPYYGNIERYNKFKILNKMYYDKFKNDIKFFYVENKENLEKELVEIDDFIYVKGNDVPLNPNFLIKMVKATGYIHDTYNYDYIVHTNLSSVWNMPVLLSLYNEIPRNNFFGGQYIFDSFITGTGIFFSKDLIPLLMKVETNIYNDFNDVSISAYMKDNNIPIFHLENMSNYRWEMIISDREYTNEHYDNILYFRIRNSSHELDITITKFLLNKLYNITV